MDGRGETLKNLEIWKEGKKKNWRKKKLERQGRSVKEGEVEEKIKQREGGREGVMLSDRGGFKMGSW